MSLLGVVALMHLFGVVAALVAYLAQEHRRWRPGRSYIEIRGKQRSVVVPCRCTRRCTYENRIPLTCKDGKPIVD